MSQTAVEPVEYHSPVYDLIECDDDLRAHLSTLADDTGPVAVDTERACGFRYFQQAYLIQLKTLASGICLIDPTKVSATALAELGVTLSDKRWIIHAASQDLPALRLAGLNPQHLFDTELSARLLGRDKVGLGSLLENIRAIKLEKTLANSDWSDRPLKEAWLSYAANDVEYLIELAEHLEAELIAAGKLAWAEQEFDHILQQPPPPPKIDPWRATADIHLVSTRLGMAVVRELWLVRDRLAAEMDLAPHRIVNDRAISALGARITENSLAPALRVFDRRDWGQHAAKKHLDDFQQALADLIEVDESALPEVKAQRNGVPAPGRWRRRNPAAAARWEVVRPAIRALAETHTLPVENLIAPRPLRAALWEPVGITPECLDQQLADFGVRPWQRDLVVPVIAELLAGLAEK